MTPLLRGGALLRPRGYLVPRSPIPSRAPTAIPLSPMPDPVCVGVGAGAGVCGGGGGGDVDIYTCIFICMHT